MSTLKSSAEHLTLNADGSGNDIKFQSNATEVAAIDQAGNLTLSGTVDGVDIQTLNTTAGAALPKAGGTMTGGVVIDGASGHLRLQGTTTTAKNVSIQYNESGDYGQINCDQSGVNQKDLWVTGLNLRFGRNTSIERMIIKDDGKVGIGTTAPLNLLQIGSSYPITMNGSYPDIHFNGYYSSPSYRTVTTGFGGRLGFHAGTGKLTMKTGASSTTAGSDYSGAEVFGISAAGIVTKPLQPAAVAYNMPNHNNGTLVYSIEKFDNAGNMNITNGRFTCPVAGVYSVSISGFYDNGRANNGDVTIRVNNSVYVRATYSNESQSTYVAITGVSLVKVAANDYITIFTEGDMHSNDATVFSVHLVG